MQNIVGKANRYTVHSFVRPGRVGDFYLGSTSDGVFVWLKMVHDEYFGEAQANARFDREAQLLSDFDHPAMLDVLEWGRTDDAAWVALQRVEGPSLRQALAPGPLHLGDVLHLATSLADALGAAHARHMVLRDVVPENVLLVNSDPWHIKLLDLGFTRLVGEPVTSDLRTRHDTRVGDPTYMAPEYIEDRGLDHRADLYSMGVVLYEALVGRPPFSGKPYQIMLAQVSEDPTPPSVLRPDTPPWLEALVLSLLEKEPSRRPHRAEKVVSALAAEVG